MSESTANEQTSEGDAPADRVEERGLAATVALAAGVPAIAILAALPFLQLGVEAPAPRLLLFLGRFHPSLLHLPIAFLLLALLMQALHLPRLRHLVPPVPDSVVDLVVGLAALSGFATAFAGWVLASEGGYDEALLGRHLYAGVATGIGAVACAMARALSRARPHDVVRRRVSAGLLVATSAVMTVAAHAGGSLTHGDGYLTEYAPAPVRRALGLHVPRDRSQEPLRVVAERQAFDGVVLRILENHCTSCHNPGKLKGGLRLDTHEGVLEGGQSGPVVRAGDADGSELVRRVLRPVDDEKHMPPRGTEQLTGDEIAVLRWWMDAGLPNEQTLREVQAPQEIRAAFVRSLPTHEQRAVEELQARLAAEYEATLANLRTSIPGSLRTITPGERDLEYTAAIAGPSFGDAELEKLSAVSDDLVWLDLSRTGVTDAGLPVIAGMAHLERLDLRQTAVGDVGVKALAALPRLETLSLYGTEVADEGLRALQAVETLRQLYVGDTEVTPEAVEALRAARPEMNISP